MKAGNLTVLSTDKYFSRLSAVAVLASLLIMSSAVSRPSEKNGFFYSDYLSQGGVSGPSLNGDAFTISPSDHAESITHRLPESRERVLSSIHGDLDSAPLSNWSSNLGAKWLDFAAAGIGRGLEGAATDSFGFIRRAKVDVRLPLGNHPAGAGVSFVGAFSNSQRHMLGWELRGYGGEKAFRGLKTSAKAHKGGSFGLLYRHVSGGRGPFGFGRYGEGLFGFNTFADYENRYGQDFIRWSGGAEVRTPWADLYSNIYRAITSPRLGERIDGATRDNYGRAAVFTSDGFDIEVNLHAPDHQWLALVGEYYTWGDYKGEAGEEGWRAGLRVEPFSFPVVVEAIHEDGDAGRDWGGRVAFNINLGKNKDTPKPRESFAANGYLYEPANREYAQRIYNVTVTMSPPSAPSALQRQEAIHPAIGGTLF